MTDHPHTKIYASKYFLWPAVTLTVVFITVCACFFSIPDAILYPNTEQFKATGYTDQKDGGTSQIIQQRVADSALTFSFRLDDGFYTPYAGFSIRPLHSDYFDVSKYNQISLTVLGHQIDRLGIGLYAAQLDEQGKRLNEEDLHHVYLNISDSKARYDIPISQFKHPDWWEDLHQIDDTENSSPALEYMRHVNINSAYTPSMEGVKTIELYAIAFTRNNIRVYVLATSIYLLTLFMLYGGMYRKIRNKKSTSRITIAYQPVEINETHPEEENCVAYINQHFHDNTLTLDSVAKATGMMPRKIAAVINDQFQCNFKTYVNRIRISEAKRLLRETDLNIGEIAYKVGFNNQSHFNRVFKAEHDMRPSEYREHQGDKKM